VRERQVRVLAVLAAATTVAAVDQWVKLAVRTPYWAFHHRSDMWFAGSCVLFVAATALALIESRAVATGTALLAGGVLGNLLSAGTDGFYVPNPLQLGNGPGIAFNLADVCILFGNLTLMLALSIFVIQRRQQLHERRLAFGRAIRERLS
jgi:lipoprotein signal peptidase